MIHFERLLVEHAYRYSDEVSDGDILRRRAPTVQVSEPVANWQLLANSQHGLQTRLHTVRCRRCCSVLDTC